MTVSHSAPARVVLHVGAPKSGTTFIQKALWRHREPLREAGFICPGENARQMFRAAVEVRGTEETWGFQPGELRGTWRRLCQQSRAFPGTSIMSHELLAAASEEQVASALAELEGLDVHIVFTARDLGRQVLSEWQERIKNGSTKTFAEFQESKARHIRTKEFTGLFWRYQDVHGVLSRWGADIPAEKLHVVVAPPPGADPRLLWQRFAEAVGFDGELLDPLTSDGVANQTLGVVQISILRKVNEALNGRIVQPAYARVVKRRFGQDLLARYSSPRPSCPPELWDGLRQLSEEWVREIAVRGYTVHGDPAELIPTESTRGGPRPDDVDPREEADMAAAVIADLLAELASRRESPGRPAPLAGRLSLPTRLGRHLSGRLRPLVRALPRR